MRETAKRTGRMAPRRRTRCSRCRPGVSLAAVGRWHSACPSTTLWASHGDENFNERCRMSWREARRILEAVDAWTRLARALLAVRARGRAL